MAYKPVFNVNKDEENKKYYYIGAGTVTVVFLLLFGYYMLPKKAESSLYEGISSNYLAGEVVKLRELPDRANFIVTNEKITPSILSNLKESEGNVYSRLALGMLANNPKIAIRVNDSISVSLKKLKRQSANREREELVNQLSPALRLFYSMYTKNPPLYSGEELATVFLTPTTLPEALKNCVEKLDEEEGSESGLFKNLFMNKFNSKNNFPFFSSSFPMFINVNSMEDIENKARQMDGEFSQILAFNVNGNIKIGEVFDTELSIKFETKESAGEKIVEQRSMPVNSIYWKEGDYHCVAVANGDNFDVLKLSPQDDISGGDLSEVTRSELCRMKNAISCIFYVFPSDAGLLIESDILVLKPDDANAISLRAKENTESGFTKIVSRTLKDVKTAKGQAVVIGMVGLGTLGVMLNTYGMPKKVVDVFNSTYEKAVSMMPSMPNIKFFGYGKQEVYRLKYVNPTYYYPSLYNYWPF